MGLQAPEVLYADGAYISSEALAQALQEGRQLKGPAPAAPDRGKVFTVEAFDVSVEERVAVCPAGRCSTNCCRLETKSTGKVDYRFEWNNATCDSCPLNPQCVSTGQKHRTFVVGEHHTLLQARRLRCRPMNSNRRCADAMASRAPKANWSVPTDSATPVTEAKPRSGFKTTSSAPPAISAACFAACSGSLLKLAPKGRPLPVNPPKARLNLQKRIQTRSKPADWSLAATKTRRCRFATS